MAHPVALGGAVRSLGLDLPADLALPEWRDVGAQLRQLHDATPWIVGDWLIFGEFTYGRKYQEAAAIVGFETTTLRTYAMVSGHFARDRRRAALSFHHHRLVVALPIAAQEEWLDAAEAEGWSFHDLAQRLTAARAEARSRGDAQLDTGPDPDGGEVAATVDVAVVTVRVPPSVQNRWAAAADAAGVTLESWVAAVLDHAAAQALEAAA